MSSRLIRLTAIAAVVAVTAFTATACGSSEASDQAKPAKSAASAAGHSDDKSEAKEKEAPHWGYEGADGPANWATLSEDFETCEKGREQSPIDLDEKIAVEHNKPISVQYEPVTAELVNNGHTIQANVSPGSGIVVDGTRYDLKQFHFHLPSEHTENGEHAAMELHFVHADKDGKLAVLGVLMDEDDAKSPFGELWKHLPAKEGQQTKITESIDLTKFLPGDRDQYRYEGSLTTPPCAEGVKWTVLKDKVHVTAEQVAQYKKLFPVSNRPVQPLNDRELDEAGS